MFAPISLLRFALVVIAALLLIVDLGERPFLANVDINWTDSMPMGYYLRRPLPDPMTRGSIVRFCPPLSAIAPIREDLERLVKGSQPCAGGSPYFLKRIIAIPGDTVTIARSGILVNGQAIPNSTVPRKLLKQFPHMALGEYRVTAHHAWVLSDAYLGYDSRYYGEIVPLMIDVPVWTWH